MQKRMQRAWLEIEPGSPIPLFMPITVMLPAYSHSMGTRKTIIFKIRKDKLRKDILENLILTLPPIQDRGLK